MKFLIASDIHGSKKAVERILELKKEEQADKVILLGDIYNHGPRNPFPEIYNPMEVAGLLNSIKNDLIVVKGNCDSEVDTMISDFDFLCNATIISSGKTIFCTHGHIYNKEHPTKTKFDAVIYGHFHTGFIKKVDDTIYANAGSVSLPKCDTPKSYILIDENTLYLKDLDKNIIDKIEL